MNGQPIGSSRTRATSSSGARRRGRTRPALVLAIVAAVLAGAFTIAQANAGASWSPTIVNKLTSFTAYCRANAPIVGSTAADQVLNYSVDAPDGVVEGGTFDILIKPTISEFPTSNSGASVYKVLGLATRYKVPTGVTVNSVTQEARDGTASLGYYFNPGADRNVVANRLEIPGGTTATWDSTKRYVVASYPGTGGTGSNSGEFRGGSAVMPPYIRVNVTATAAVGTNLSLTLGGAVPSNSASFPWADPTFSSTARVNAPLVGATAVPAYCAPTAAQSPMVLSNTLVRAAEPVDVETTTSVSAAPTSIQTGGSTTLTANVSGAPSVGTVTFSDGTTTFGPANVTAGVASVPASFATAGAKHISASYSGGTGFLASASTTDATVTVTTPPPPNVAPTAAASASATTGVTPFTVAFNGSGSTDGDGTIASYAWNFGDATTGTGATTGHTYTTPGTYTATLTVTDDDGATDTATVTITVTSPTPTNNAPTASFSVTPSSGVAPLDVIVNGTGSSDSDGAVVSYAWDFGDGTLDSGSMAGHTYTAAGTRTITLTVTDDDGATASTTRTVVVTSPPVPNVAPTASFTATPTSGTAPLAVSVNASASSDSDGSIVSYAWTFGDGGTGTGTTSNHTYTTAGTRTITLTVTDDDGATATTTRTVTANPAPIPNVAPTASFTATPTSGTTPLVVSVNAGASTDSDGTITSYAWNFGDGGTGTGTTSNHTYTTAGTRTISLTVTDDDGATATTTRTVTATTPGAPNVAPTASFTLTPSAGPAPLSVSLDATGSSDSDGSIVSYAWDFGNGTGSGATALRAYLTPGNYPVTLTVTDNKGATATSTQTVVVEAPGARDRITLRLTGHVTYLYDGGITSGNQTITRDAFGVSKIAGTSVYPSTVPAAPAASVTTTLTRLLPGLNVYYGTVVINDAAAGVNNLLTPVVFQSVAKPSATSISGTMPWFFTAPWPNLVNPYTLQYTIDDLS